MFNCYQCGKTIGPRIKPQTIITDVRTTQYHNEFFVEDELGNRELRKVDSVGREIVHEIKVCDADAAFLLGLEYTEPTPKPVTVKHPPRNQELVAKPFTTALIAVAVHNALDKLGHESKRAKADGMLVVPLIKRFTDANPKFIF